MSGNTTDSNSQKKPVTEIKTVELKPGVRFTANGKTYIVNDTFTIGRLEQVNLMEDELASLSNRDSCHKVMLEAMDLINAIKPGNAWNLLYNKVNSDKTSARLMHYTLRIVTAYINYEGEDLAFLTEQQIAEKMNDWSVEGLDATPFIAFAMTVYKELFLSYKKDILNTLTEQRSIRDSLNMAMDMSNTDQNKDGQNNTGANS